MNKTGIITGVVKREDDRAGKWTRIVSIEVETDKGPLVLQITPVAAYDLKAYLAQPSRLVGEWPDAREL